MAFHEPATKRVAAFVDGQNLFYAAKTSFGHRHPNYDILALATAICKTKSWNLIETRFYTGIPDPTDNAFWNHFWTAKLAQMGRQGIKVFSRPLRYRNVEVNLPNGTTQTALVGQEKGIDVRLAIDVISCAHRRAYDVALVFSQDQDLSEVADELRQLQVQQIRWIKMACAFPFSPTSKNKRGINGADWLQIDRALYDSCLDTRDYRPKPASTP
jgi:uncharacterized LabA/DUF88 family protein